MAFDNEVVRPAPLVVLVDPLAMARRGLRWLLDSCGADLQVLEAPDMATALPVMRRTGEGIVILGHRPPRLDALAVLRRLRGSGCGFRVAILAGELGPRSIREALTLDVDGLLPDDVTPEQLGQCVAALLTQGRWLSIDVLRVFVEGDDAVAPQLASALDGLTPRQREIADLVGEGLSNKAIARALGIAEGTVKMQLHRIYKRTGHRNRALLAAAVNLPKAGAGA